MFVCVRMLFTVTDRASTIPSSIRDCQSGTWSAGQENIKRASSKLQREVTGNFVGGEPSDRVV